MYEDAVDVDIRRKRLVMDLVGVDPAEIVRGYEQAWAQRLRKTA